LNEKPLSQPKYWGFGFRTIQTILFKLLNPERQDWNNGNGWNGMELTFLVNQNQTDIYLLEF